MHAKSHIYFMSHVASAARELGTLVEVADPLPSPLLLKHRQQAVSHEGSLERLTRLLRHLETGGANATIAVLGGSVSAGSSSRVRPDQSGLYHRKLHRWLQQRFPRATVRHINAAMPAVYQSLLCLWCSRRQGRPPTGGQPPWATLVAYR